MSADGGKVYKRAEFWEPETCTLLDIANVLGRWDSASEWAERNEFSLLRARRTVDLSNQATLERYEYATRNGLVERVAMQQNVPKLPFKNSMLAAAYGKSVKDFEALPVSGTAIDVVFDALVESKSGLIAEALCDKRRDRWLSSEGGGINEGALAAGLFKSRALVCFSWVFFGKGRLYGFAVAAKLALDATGKDALPPLIADYAEWILLAVVLVLAVQGVQGQADVLATTGDYATVSKAEALADREAAKTRPLADEEYVTVFEKWAVNSAKSKAADGAAPAEVDTSFVVPLTLVLGTVLFLSGKG